jgi:hypothetical protein
VYIDSQQDAGERRKTGRPQRQPDAPNRRAFKDVPQTKKERQGLGPPLKKNSQNAFAHQRKEIQMLRNHASQNIGSIGRVVNGFVALVSFALIGAAYFAAVGQFVA